MTPVLVNGFFPQRSRNGNKLPVASLTFLTRCRKPGLRRTCVFISEQNSDGAIDNVQDWNSVAAAKDRSFPGCARGVVTAFVRAVHVRNNRWGCDGRERCSGFR